MAKIGPEASLQVMVNKCVRSHVPMPHFFFSIDRSRKHSAFEHVHQKARGMIAGIPDTCLIYPGLPAIMIELKAKGSKLIPGSSQDLVGHAILKAGGCWWWCDSVLEYMKILHRLNIPLLPNWELAAASHDATLEGAAIRRAEAGGVVSPARRKPRPSPAALKVMARARAAGIIG